MIQMIEDCINQLDNAKAYIKFLEEDNERLYKLIEKLERKIKNNIKQNE